MRTITSRDNPLFRQVHELAHSSRERRRLQRSFIEGIHLCDAYLRSRREPCHAIVAQAALVDPEVEGLLAALPPGIDTVVVADELFRALSSLAQGGTIAFVVDTPRPPLPARVEHDAVYLDRVQDPGNVGTILRNCAAAGVFEVFTSPHTAWCWSPKVLRAAMGAHFHLRICESVGFEELAPRLAVEAVGTRAHDAESIHAVSLSAPRLWVFGNEGEGVSPQVAAGVTRWLRIPQHPEVESLNVAAAAAVCLFEQRRQRGTSLSGAGSAS